MSSDVDEIAVSDAYMYTIVVCRGYTTALERGTHVALCRKQFCHVTSEVLTTQHRSATRNSASRGTLRSRQCPPNSYRKMFTAVVCALTNFVWPPGIDAAEVRSDAALQSHAMDAGVQGLRATASRGERQKAERSGLNATMELGGSIHAVAESGKALLKCINYYAQAFLHLKHPQMLLARHSLHDSVDPDSGSEDGYDSDDTDPGADVGADAGAAGVSNPCPNFASYAASMVALTILRLNGIHPSHGARAVLLNPPTDALTRWRVIMRAFSLIC